ncbi:MAG: hypothetical protein AABY17_06200 [Thermoproteota archaeon]
MKNTRGIRSADKGTATITEAIAQSKHMELQSKTIEEQRLKIALDLRIMNVNDITKIKA